MRRLLWALLVASLVLNACSAAPSAPDDSVTPAPPEDHSKDAFIGPYVLELAVWGTGEPDRTVRVSLDRFKPYGRVGAGVWDEGVVYVTLEPVGDFLGASWTLEADLYRSDAPVDLGPEHPLAPPYSEQVLSVTAKAPASTQDFSGTATYSNCNEAWCNQTRTAALRKVR